MRTLVPRITSALAISGAGGVGFLFALEATAVPEWIALLGALASVTALAGALCLALVLGPLQRRHQELRRDYDRATRRLEEAQEVGRIGWWSYDFSTGRIEASRALARLFGLDIEAAPSTPDEFLDLILEEDRAPFKADLQKAVRTHAASDVTFRAVVEGSLREYRLRARISYDEAGRPAWSVGTVQDITEERRGARERAAFVSTVTHELRTPLTSIVGSLSLLRGGAMGEVPTNMRSAVNMAEANSRRLSDLVDDILDSERLMSGEMQMEFEEIGLEDFAAEAVETNSGYGEQLGVAFRDEIVADGLVVRGDRSRLLQVMSNLLSNAAKFSDANSEVIVKVAREGDEAIVSVIDQGQGIPEEAQGTIFDRFTQAHGHAGRNAHSTGLGLNISKQIVERHDGVLELSSSPGEGSTFSVRLPVERVDLSLGGNGTRSAAGLSSVGLNAMMLLGLV
ncbi:sensor histidine kinase [Salipiger mucosus]|uniref:histidine kinase n=1 Tax=Salipiger mucosus DSM 16094 TaxID=1123237 RepID=S9Q9T8_9RHOB|nr:HAMP domain-containing sensor histidine kinase [Salipiger mucosus]EPX76403.1 hypothetical protein Salmuc_02905 [Salipiger mucosus DSM 16094]